MEFELRARVRWWTKRPWAEHVRCNRNASLCQRSCRKWWVTVFIKIWFYLDLMKNNVILFKMELWRDCQGFRAIHSNNWVSKVTTFRIKILKAFFSAPCNLTHSSKLTADYYLNLGIWRLHYFSRFQLSPFLPVQHISVHTQFLISFVYTDTVAGFLKYCWQTSSFPE